jgi:hypothetical protein
LKFYGVKQRLSSAHAWKLSGFQAEAKIRPNVKPVQWSKTESLKCTKINGVAKTNETTGNGALFLLYSLKYPITKIPKTKHIFFCSEWK